MPASSRSTAILIALACSVSLLASQAQAFDLTGAWATSADACTKIFVKKGNQITFTQFAEEFGGGFVAEAKQIRSKVARCAIKSRKEAGDIIDLQAACASDIMATSMLLRIKILDDNSVSRIFPDPGMEDMQVTYYRCAM
jgi:hypothetical protein